MLRWEASLQMLKEERLSCIMQVLLFQTGLSQFGQMRSLAHLWVRWQFQGFWKTNPLYLGRDTDKPNSMRTRKVLSPTIERATFAWFSLMEEKSTTISDNVLCSIAERFMLIFRKHQGAKNIKYFSKGWVAGFKKRHGIKGFVYHVKRPLQIKQKRQRLEFKRSKTRLQPTTLATY